MTLKAEKTVGIIQKEVSGIIQFSLKGPKTGFVTVTDVTMINDLSIAKTYISSPGQKSREEVGMKTLDRSRGYLRSEPAKWVTTRKVSELVFKLGDPLRRGNKIKRVISEVNK